jgi:hypothetical protein
MSTIRNYFSPAFERLGGVTASVSANVIGWLSAKRLLFGNRARGLCRRKSAAAVAASHFDCNVMSNTSRSQSKYWRKVSPKRVFAPSPGMKARMVNYLRALPPSVYSWRIAITCGKNHALKSGSSWNGRSESARRQIIGSQHCQGVYRESDSFTYPSQSLISYTAWNLSGRTSPKLHNGVKALVFCIYSLCPNLRLRH